MIGGVDFFVAGVASVIEQQRERVAAVEEGLGMMTAVAGVRVLCVGMSVATTERLQNSLVSRWRGMRRYFYVLPRFEVVFFLFFEGAAAVEERLGMVIAKAGMRVLCAGMSVATGVLAEFAGKSTEGYEALLLCSLSFLGLFSFMFLG